MADDDKQVEIEVALRDTASATLRGISREIDNITRKLVETGRKGNEALDSLRRKGGEAGQGSNKAAEGVDKFTKSITGLAKSLVGPLGLAGAFYAVGKSLSSFVHSKAELSLLTADLGLTATKMGEVKQILMRKGFSEEAAKKFITTIAGQLQDLKVHDVYSEFYRRLEIYGDAKLTESVIKSVKSDKVSEAFDTVISHTQKLLESKDPQNRLRGQYAARELLGQTPAYFTQWRDYNKDLVAGAKSDTDELKKALQEEIDLRTKIGNIKTETLMWVLKTLTGISGAAKESEAPKPPPGAPGSPNIGTDDKGLKVYGPRSTSPTAPPIEVPMPGTIGPRSDLDLGTSGSTEWSSSNRPRRGTVAKTLDEIEPIEKETNQTLISIRDILQAMYGDPTKPPGSPTSSGSPTSGSPTGPTGGSRPGGPSVGSIGAMGGTVYGHKVEPYGSWTGTELVDPVTGTALLGGVGSNSTGLGSGNHMGLDIKGAPNSAVVSPAAGIVKRVGTDGRYGNQSIVIDHGGGRISRILHINGVPFKVNDPVRAGQQIGRVGFANEWHIHWEMFKGGTNKQGHPYGTLSNPRAVMGYSGSNLPVIKTPRTGRGPSDTPTPVVTPSVTPSVGPSSGRKTPFQIAREAAIAAGIKDPDTAAAIAMYESGYMKRGNRSVFDLSGGTNTFGQIVPAGTPGAVLGKDGQWHARYGSLQEGFDFHKKRWGDAYGDTPGETLAEMRRRGYNSENPRWKSDIEAIRRREVDKANARGRGRQSSNRDSRVRASVDFGAMQKVREAGEIFMPVRTASFGQGSTVHRNASLPGGDYTRWTA